MVTINDIKLSAKLLDFGDNEDAKQITDTEIQSVLDTVSSFYNFYLTNLGIDDRDDDRVNRLIVLETIIRLCLSNYNDSQKTYIEALKLERDNYKTDIEKSIRRFTGSRRYIKPPKIKEGLYD